jgi:tetratricopeptide (TPR) repeat protein
MPSSPRPRRGASSSLSRPARTALLAAALVLALVGVTLVRPAGAAPRGRANWPTLKNQRTLDAIDSLVARGLGPALAHVDSLLVGARAHDDSGLVAVLELERASYRQFALGALDEARTTARRWSPLLQARADTLGWCWTLRMQGYADLMQERYADSRRHYRRMLELSQRAHLPLWEGYALLGSSFLSLQASRPREAERGYRRALRLLEHGPDRRAERTARAGLANTLESEGRPDAARIEYERVLADSKAAHDTYNEAAALNDLGTIEMQFGDPSLAEPLFRAAAARHHDLKMFTSERDSRRNAALCMMAINQSEAAAALLDSLAGEARAAGTPDIEARVLGDLGLSLAHSGAVAPAEAALRRAIALRDSISFGAWIDAVIDLGSIQLRIGRTTEARRILETARTAAHDHPNPAYTCGYLIMLGRAERMDGDPRAAIAPLRSALASLHGLHGVVGALLIDGESQLAECFHALGQRDSSLVHLRLAAEGWETQRAAPSTLEWRRAFDETAPQVYVRYLVALLDPARGGSASSRAAEAFEAMQRFRSRTLEDQLRGAQGRARLPRVSLARLQHDVLRPGEVLLDIFAAPDTSIVFTVTHSSCRAAWAPGLWAAAERLGRLRSLVAAPQAGSADLGAAEAALGKVVLEPALPEVRGARTVLVSGGWLNEYPIGMLRVPGESEPLAAHRTFAYVPSATLLAAEREAAPRRSPTPGIAGLCRFTDIEGRRLPGVESEARWLARRFPGAPIRTNDGRRSLDDMLHGRLDVDVVHVASHTRLSSSSPWRSGFLLGRGGGEDAYLTAGRIAQLPSAARVCVLAGCSSAGVVGAPEGMPNLAAAWLTAGAGCVVATLWPVDDAATARLVERLYDGFARGATVGEALASAQRAVRSEPAHADPRYWAGFVLMGDPDVRVRLAATK